MNRLSKGLMLVAVLFSISQSYAQDVWNLERCINHALEHNLDIQQADLAVAQADINATQAKHARYPSLNGSTGLNLNFGRTVDPTNNDFITARFLSNNISLSSGVTLYNAGQISNSIKQSNVNKQSAEKNRVQRERDISLTVASAYLNTLFAEENLANSNNQLTLVQEQYKQLESLVRAGARAENELLDLEAQLATAEQNIITQENAIAISLLNLKQLLMLDPNYDLILDRPNEVEIVTDADLITFDEIYKAALMHQAGIQAAELDVESARIGEKIAQSAFYPRVTLGGQIGTNYSNQGKKVDAIESTITTRTLYIDNSPVEVGFPTQNAITSNNPYFNQLDENLSYGVGLGVSIPIYNNYSAKAGVERAKLNVLNSSIQVERQKNLLKTNVQQALADAQAAAKRYTAAQKSQRAQQRAFENAQKRFDLGSINSFDMVNARNLYDNAQTNLLIAKYDYLFKAKVIDFYMGRNISNN